MAVKELRLKHHKVDNQMVHILAALLWQLKVLNRTLRENYTADRLSI